MQSATPGTELQYRQLFPQSRTVTVDDALSALDPAEHAGREFPYMLVNFVCTADGRAAFGGRSGPIGDEGDRQLFHGLRERVDAVMAGTSTLRTENYGRIMSKPYRRERRANRGLTPASPKRASTAAHSRGSICTTLSAKDYTTRAPSCWEPN